MPDRATRFTDCAPCSSAGTEGPARDAVTLASQQFAEVQQLIDEGQWDAAQDKLETLTTTVATVNDVEQKQDLVTPW